ncbi:MAG: hypothetical protein ACE5K7_07490 [Phycisphaerae bacterium]
MRSVWTGTISPAWPPRAVAWLLCLAAAGCSLPDWQLRQALAHDQRLADLAEQQTRLQLARPQLLAAFGPDHRAVKALDYQVRQIAQMRQQRREQIRRQTLARRHLARRPQQ